jgi:Ca2+-binding EF-hand superfamily protein
VDGNGYLSKEETRHFCKKYLKEFKGIEMMSEVQFEAWFKGIDKDKNGFIDMVEMSQYIKALGKLMQRPPMLNSQEELHINSKRHQF